MLLKTFSGERKIYVRIEIERFEINFIFCGKKLFALNGFSFLIPLAIVEASSRKYFWL